jgi:hypothetical protein
MGGDGAFLSTLQRMESAAPIFDEKSGWRIYTGYIGLIAGICYIAFPAAIL